MIILPAVLESYRSLKDRSVKISFETGELSPSQAGDIQGNILKAGFLAFKSDVFKENEKQLLESIEVDYDDKGKSPSQRMRSVLYVLWKKDGEGYSVFNHYYEAKMEKFIESLKKKIDE